MRIPREIWQSTTLTQPTRGWLRWSTGSRHMLQKKWFSRSKKGPKTCNMVKHCSPASDTVPETFNEPVSLIIEGILAQIIDSINSAHLSARPFRGPMFASYAFPYSRYCYFRFAAKRTVVWVVSVVCNFSPLLPAEVTLFYRIRLSQLLLQYKKYCNFHALQHVSVKRSYLVLRYGIRVIHKYRTIISQRSFCC